MILRLFRSLMPKEEGFFDYFEGHADRLAAASDALAALLHAPPAEQAPLMRQVATIESEADAISRQTVVALHRAFITPFDRSDIHALTTALDDTVDLMEEVTEHATLYGIDDFDARMREFGALIQKQARLLLALMPMLRNITGNAERIKGLCDQIGKIESDGDRLLRSALSELIARKPEVIEFLARKEVYQLLEDITDRCDDVADIVQGIVLDHV